MKHLNLIDRAFLLKKTQLFGSLDLDLLLTIADKVEQNPFEEGEEVFSVGQDANQMFVIIEGEISIENDRKQSLGLLKGGDFFGDESLFNDKNRDYNAKCKTPSLLLSLSRNHLLGIIAECPSVAIALLEAYSAHTEFRKRA